MLLFGGSVVAAMIIQPSETHLPKPFGGSGASLARQREAKFPTYIDTLVFVSGSLQILDSSMR